MDSVPRANKKIIYELEKLCFFVNFSFLNIFKRITMHCYRRHWSFYGFASSISFTFKIFVTVLNFFFFFVCELDKLFRWRSAIHAFRPLYYNITCFMYYIQLEEKLHVTRSAQFYRNEKCRFNMEESPQSLFYRTFR